MFRFREGRLYSGSLHLWGILQTTSLVGVNVSGKFSKDSEDLLIILWILSILIYIMSQLENSSVSIQLAKPGNHLLWHQHQQTWGGRRPHHGDIVQCSTVQYSTVQCIQYSIVQCIQYSSGGRAMEGHKYGLKLENDENEKKKKAGNNEGWSHVVRSSEW